MTIIYLGLLLITVSALVAAKRQMPGARVVLSAALAAIFIAVAFRSCTRASNSPARQRVSDEKTAGHALGVILVGDMKEGALLVLRNPPNAKIKRDITAVRHDGLTEAIKTASFTTVMAGPNRANFGSDDPACTLFSEDTLDQEVQQWLAAHKEINAVVSLLPTSPHISARQPLYGFVDSRDTGWVEGIKSGRIKAAIMYRFHPLPPETKPEANNGLPPKFILVTPASLDEAIKDQQF